MWHVRAHTHTHTTREQIYISAWRHTGDNSLSARMMLRYFCISWYAMHATFFTSLNVVLCGGLRPAQVNNAFPGRCAFKIPQDLAWWKMCWVELCSIHPHEYHQQSVKTHKLLRQACWCLLTAWGDKLAGKVQTTSCVLNGALMGTASEAFAGQLSQTSSRTQNLFHELAMCIFPCVLFIKITASHVLPSAIPQPGLEDVVLFSVPLDQPGLTQSHMGVLPMSQVDPIWKSEGPYTYVQRYGWTWCVLNFTICLKIFKLKGQN